MTCLGVLNKKKKRGDGNETGLKKGEGTEIETTVLPQMHALLRFVFVYLRKW